MDVSRLFQPPANEAEIQERLTAAQEFFITVQAERLGVDIVDLRILLPETLMQDRNFSTFAEDSSAYGAYSSHAYQLVLNMDVLYEGAMSIELIALHEYTHFFDHLLFECLIKPDECRARLKRLFLEYELPAQGRMHMAYVGSWKKIVRPSWSCCQLGEAARVLNEVLNIPEKFLKLRKDGCALGPKSAFVEQLERLGLGESDSAFWAASYFNVLYVLYWYASKYETEGMTQEQRIALNLLSGKMREHYSFWAEQNLDILLSLTSGNYNRQFGVLGLECKDYFDLPEPLQLSYLCSKGEIHARQEASRLLLMAIEQWPASTHPPGALKRQLDGEVQTLRASMKLETLLHRWELLRTRLPEAVFEASRQRRDIEAKIQALAVLSRTHKLIRRFYPSEEAYQFSRIWNEKRLLPLPQEWPQVAGLSGIEALSEFMPEDLAPLPSERSAS